MKKNAKIYIAGHRGLVGSAIVRNLQTKGYTNLLMRAHAELDLTKQAATDAFFAAEKPDYVFLAAAKVGGIHANNEYPAEFIRDNLAIQSNIIHAAWQNNATRLMFLGSSCIYPKLAPQPMKEEYLLTGPLEPTNRPYALAKIAGIEMCWSYNRQYGTHYLAVMPTNLYGPGDNYHPENSHVIPALIRKFHEAKQAKAPSVSVWGTGTPRREFMYSEDTVSYTHLDVYKRQVRGCAERGRHRLVRGNLGLDRAPGALSRDRIERSSFASADRPADALVDHRRREDALPVPGDPPGRRWPGG